MQLRRVGSFGLVSSPFELAFLLREEAAARYSREVLAIGDVAQLLLHAFNNNFIAIPSSHSIID